MKYETTAFDSDRLELSTADLFRLLAGDTLNDSALSVACPDALPFPQNTALIRLCRGVADKQITECEAEIMLRIIGREIFTGKGANRVASFRFSAPRYTILPRFFGAWCDEDATIEVHWLGRARAWRFPRGSRS